MKRATVLGATGMAGHVIALSLEEDGYDTYRMSKDITPKVKSAQIDAVNFTLLMDWLEKVRPDIIVNAIGILPKEADLKPDLAILLNSYLPRMLEQHYRNSETKIIHLSTDCVFSGETGGYTENSPTDGTSIYDRSKTLGEIINDKDLTFRMSIIGPDMNFNGVGLFNWFMKQHGRINGYTRAMWNGITTIELSKAIIQGINQNLTGLYHLTPQDNISKYALLCLFKEEFGKMDVEVIPYDQFVVDKTLINNRTDFAYKIHSYPEMIHEMASWINGHSGLYKLC
jgi:dTDP-4-dehydrorhamnose reductase